MATTDRYKVEVRVAIQKVTEHGSYTSDRLSFEDSTDLGSLNFEQIAGLLMRFHDLSQTATAELAAGSVDTGADTYLGCKKCRRPIREHETAEGKVICPPWATPEDGEAG